VLSLGEVASAAKLDKGTARRLLLTLTHAGLVNQDPLTRRYSLGIAILELAGAVEDNRTMRQEARIVLSELARRTGTTAFLGIVRDGQALCLERVDGDHPVQVRAWNVGAQLPLNCGGAPRVLLAYSSSATVDAVVRRGLCALTPKSQTNATALRRDLARIRRRGWELAVDDVTAGIAALGVPVRNAKREIVAAISIGGLTQHLVQGRRLRFLQAVLSSARDLGFRMSSG
jgi:DNA-binding IclR family transcriptional regulator